MRSSRGFSLVEILVAMVLLVGVSGLAFSAFSSSSKTIANSPNNTATNLARGITETLHEVVRADQGWNPATGKYPVGSPLSEAPAAQTGTTLNSVSYAPSYTVAGADLNGDGIDDYKRVRATVQW